MDIITNFFRCKKVYLSALLILISLVSIAAFIHISPSFSAKTEVDYENELKENGPPISENEPTSSESDSSISETEPTQSHDEQTLAENSNNIAATTTQGQTQTSKPSNGSRQPNPQVKATASANPNVRTTTPPTTAVAPSQTSPMDKMTIVMVPINPFMTINGIMMEIDPPGRGTSPIIEHGRTLIPISAIVSVLGGNTSWNNEAKSITVELNNTIMEFTLNNRNVIVNGVSKQLDVPPKIVNNRTLVPIRFLVENCNVSIEYKNKKIIIVANYLPEGMQRAKNLFDSTAEIESFSKIPSIINTLTRVY